MRDTNLVLWEIFTKLETGETVQVHDYAVFEYSSFDYVPDHFIGQKLPVAFDGQFARPIVDPLEILGMLKTPTCVCGEYKKTGMSHCRNCYYALPREMQTALYRQFRDGYEQAFLMSLIHLTANDRCTVQSIQIAAGKVNRVNGAARLVKRK